MITYDLECGNGHHFEGWFEDNDSFENQRDRNMVSCPYCDSNSITKLMSTFAIKNGSASSKNSNKIVNKLKEYIDNNFDDVGTDFASEALKMHYGVVKPRNIKGVSSSEEEKMMNSEGVKFLKIPLSSDKNGRKQNC